MLNIVYSPSIKHNSESNKSNNTDNSVCLIFVKTIMKEMNHDGETRNTLEALNRPKNNPRGVQMAPVIGVLSADPDGMSLVCYR